ncbi:hypothetical protein QWY16_10465 [Planococcus shenhongbingii]|uniref:Uncharacterized protein n=1 Tax=Planococcus shenhongbingii TaxID=3058398 RepID=A0ABT8NGN2_9BACL|nr:MULTISPECIES: hypothetical protein [unclassified Planococcus (in: firmicutes)]MDN7247037.1 hypothetical protein [Planococcus sp. N017]WKA56940.1 hypothetical protein QWY16_10465 [Planococcus sp. N016]
MNAVIREEKRVNGQTTSYLQMYQEFIKGYKQYKEERVNQYTKAAKAESDEK